MVKQFVIDFQCFRAKVENSKIILKELCVESLDDSFYFYSLFAPPYPFKQLAPKEKVNCLWLTNNHHGIPWSWGDTSLDYLKSCNLLKKFQENNEPIVFYVKGIEKMVWLKFLLKNYNLVDKIGEPNMVKIINVENLGLNEKLSDMVDLKNNICSNHFGNKIKACAQAHVKILSDFLKSNTEMCCACNCFTLPKTINSFSYE